jgi:Ca2+-binding EF-hand superfamily protein
MQIGALPGLAHVYSIAVEEFALDRMIDERGRPEKDVSHEPSRWLWLAEIERILSVDKEQLGTDLQYHGVRPGPGVTARLHHAALDVDRSGFLEGKEHATAGVQFDTDGDGRISLAELARAGGAAPLIAERSGGPTRELPELLGEHPLARLLGGVNPFDHDRDRSDSLSRTETERAFFNALDLDGDGQLSRDELSRHPGELRELRFGGPSATRLFRTRDKNRDGHVSAREFVLADAEWRSLDTDGDGSVRLVAPRLEAQRTRGLVLAGSEWPSLRSDLVLLSPLADVESLLAAFDGDENEILDQRELAARPDLLESLDANRDLRIVRDELARGLARLADDGVRSLPDDFEGRWDLDGDGQVEAEELPAGARLRLRLE